MSTLPPPTSWSTRLRTATASVTLRAAPDFEALAVALDLAARAAEAIQRIATEGIERSHKADKTLVTNADLAADALITDGLRAAFPDEAILSEESGQRDGAGARRIWVVDPIDGTKAYAKQIPGFSVMIGRLDGDRPDLGVVFDPVEPVVYLALRGAGAYVLYPDGRGLERVELTGTSFDSPLTLITTPSCPEKTRSRLLVSGRLRLGSTINSVGIKVGLLLRGAAEIYFSHHGLSYWDTVAPLAIAFEAGARASLVDGEQLRYDCQSADRRRSHDAPLVVSPASIHDEALQLVRAALVEKEPTPC
ncbi:MAG: hypothetical protein KC609_11375 [Myxococcales bacterium]|nr:hypothetical protein [Myxococcales bacterium]